MRSSAKGSSKWRSPTKATAWRPHWRMPPGEATPVSFDNAARAIGAWRLAAAAAEIEASGALTADAVAVLAATMTEVTDFIAARLAA